MFIFFPFLGQIPDILDFYVCLLRVEEGGEMWGSKRRVTFRVCIFNSVFCAFFLVQNFVNEPCHTLTQRRSFLDFLMQQYVLISILGRLTADDIKQSC